MGFFTPSRRKIGLAAIVLGGLTVGLYLTDRLYLPSRKAILNMEPPELRDIILKTTPVRMDRAEVEHALNWKFRRWWKLISWASVESISQRHFNILVEDGDYYLCSDFAISWHLLPDIVTVRFLFDRTDKLKDVSVQKWCETI